MFIQPDVCSTQISRRLTGYRIIHCVTFFNVRITTIPDWLHVHLVHGSTRIRPVSIATRSNRIPETRIFILITYIIYVPVAPACTSNVRLIAVCITMSTGISFERMGFQFDMGLANHFKMYRFSFQCCASLLLNQYPTFLVSNRGTGDRLKCHALVSCCTLCCLSRSLLGSERLKYAFISNDMSMTRSDIWRWEFWCR